MAKIIRYCKVNEEHMGPNVFNIMRPNILGNPYTHIKNGKTTAQVVVNSRSEAVDAYRLYFDVAYKKNPEFKAEVDKIFEAYNKYDVIYLGCTCPETERCHGDVIMQKISQMAVKSRMKDLIKMRDKLKKGK